MEKVSASAKSFGPFLLGPNIGGGGQAEVYTASKIGVEGVQVALKVIRTRHAKKKARFLKEIEAHRKLTARNARNIIPLLDAGATEVAGGRIEAYIAMPIATHSLDDASGVFTGRLELCLEVFQGIVNGVAAAHGEGIIHRDIKPTNVLFMDSDYREPLVSDFGICFLKDTPADGRVTEALETVGAKYFMAPEQSRGGQIEVTPCADIYSLGKLLLFMLTRRTLHREHLEEAFTAEEIKSDGRLRSVRRELLEQVIIEDPSSRVQTCQELSSEVARFTRSVKRHRRFFAIRSWLPLR